MRERDLTDPRLLPEHVKQIHPGTPAYDQTVISMAKQGVLYSTGKRERTSLLLDGIVVEYNQLEVGALMKLPPSIGITPGNLINLLRQRGLEYAVDFHVSVPDRDERGKKVPPRDRWRVIRRITGAPMLSKIFHSQDALKEAIRQRREFRQRIEGARSWLDPKPLPKNFNPVKEILKLAREEQEARVSQAEIDAIHRRAVQDAEAAEEADRRQRALEEQVGGEVVYFGPQLAKPRQ